MRETLLTILLAGLLITSATAQDVGPDFTSHEADVTAFQSQEEEDDEGDGYELSAASPNPFDFRTSFSIEVEERQEILVEVYNLLGQRVRSLYQGVLEPGFPMTLHFEAENLPNGLYVYRVRGETFEASRKVTLLR